MILINDSRNKNVIESFVKHFKQDTLVWPQSKFNKRIPKDVTAVVSEGMGFGTLLFKQCKDLGIDFYVFDSGYFSGYRDEYFKISKNKLHITTINNNVGSERYELLFDSNKIEKWNNYGVGDYVLILPPSNYEKFYYEDYYWAEDISQRLRDNGYEGKIRIRARKKDKIFNTEDLNAIHKINEFKTTMEEDIENAYAVISHSSTWAIQAAMKGKPIYTSEHGPGYPLNFDFDDLVKTYPNPLPKPKQLEQYIYTLAYSNFNYQEIESGYAWEKVNAV